jgi:hypothetical protein
MAMRYSEIEEMVGVKKFQNMTSADIEKFFGGNFNSVKLLGVGMHAMALQIGEEVYKFWLVDSAYEAFARYCMANQGNQFLPKFHGGIKTMPAFFLRSSNAPDVVKYVKMEKLIPVGHLTGNSWEVHPEFQDEEEEDEWGSYRYVNFENVVQLCEKALFKDLNGFTHAMQNNRGANFTYNPTNFDPVLTLLVNTIMDIMELGDNHLDLHAGNVMKRADGQLVILDPIANNKDVALNNEFLKFAFRPKDRREGGKTASRTSGSQDLRNSQDGSSGISK